MPDDIKKTTKNWDLEFKELWSEGLSEEVANKVFKSLSELKEEPVPLGLKAKLVHIDMPREGVLHFLEGVTRSQLLFASVCAAILILVFVPKGEQLFPEKGPKQEQIAMSDGEIIDSFDDEFSDTTLVALVDDHEFDLFDVGEI